MDNKKVLIFGGVIIALGVGFYLWNKSKNTTSDSNGVADTTLADTNTKSTDDSTSSEQNAETESSAKNSKSIKDLKGKEKKDFKKSTKDICKEKYGKGKDYRNCQKTVKGGGVAFDGNYYESTNDFTNFEGLNLDL
jgi:hypothetical protein